MLKHLFCAVMLLAAGINHAAECSSGEPAPGVALIVIDGFRPDKFEAADTPFLDRLAGEGAFTDRARSVNPTITRVNFVTMSTGTHVDRHGVVGGAYRDADFAERRTDGPTYREAQDMVPVPTLFEILEDHGFRTGMFAMKGYELVGARGASVQVGGRDLYPDEIWSYRYTLSVEGSAEEGLRRRIKMNDLLVEALGEVLAGESLDFFIINLGATDYVGHIHGPESDAYIRALEATDTHVGRIARLLSEYDPGRSWRFIIASDHGFTQTNEEQVVLPVEVDPHNIPELADAGIEHKLYERGGRAAEVYLKDRDTHGKAFEILSALAWVDRIYTEHDIGGRAGTLSELKVLYPGRHGDFYIMTDPSYALNFANPGQHGSNDESDVRIPLIIHAPGRVPSNADIDNASNADLAPTIAGLLGVEDDRIRAMDGRALIDLK